MNATVENDRWQELVRERVEARASQAFARLGSNRVPDSHPVCVENSDAVFERIRHIVQHSM